MATKDQVIKLAKANPIQARLIMSRMNKVDVRSLSLAQRVAFAKKMAALKAKPRTVQGMTSFGRACRRSGSAKSICGCKQCVIARKTIKGTVTL